MYVDSMWDGSTVLELAIMGFLAEGPLHGYELRRRVARLSGHTRPVSDGSLYPAINRLARAGLLTRRAEPGASAAQRHVLSLTEDGRRELLRRLREPADQDITDSTRFFTILAFLSTLPDIAEQHAVLRRRLEFLERPASFFHDGDRPLRAADVDDPYRRGMLVIAQATNRAERAWLREILD
ncbi:PadR family transcriptional regulator [Streptoalloteichus hindustanus]|uniref:Transcriptional regulator, PadR family n=1 Tax=Streptoalloteichus hindustanus TaxID=2017 RepID=A0A1M5CW82_STRHI|nr:PadR family transcriptional regulator [Streptoalloteichus hindustanus]SHF59004.1 transcriptional regulator, PadR family [Streptoalloteichus hindustanus]